MCQYRNVCLVLDFCSENVSSTYVSLSAFIPSKAEVEGKPETDTPDTVRNPHNIRTPSLYTTKLLSTMAEPTKQETEQVFRVLRAQKGNKVCNTPSQNCRGMLKVAFSHVLTAMLEIRLGLVSPLAYTYV